MTDAVPKKNKGGGRQPGAGRPKGRWKAEARKRKPSKDVLMAKQKATLDAAEKLAPLHPSQVGGRAAHWKGRQAELSRGQDEVLMTDIPPPLVPADCDLRDFPFMPVDITKLFGSGFHASSHDSE
ncbi:hypothetical protein FZC33_00345 [Labrys sp. KNU-23]|uniref:hypothetical protein n=1 Tax=Labrys sp. KNU-23 TaxID=2789216 RepID=UPI0011ECADCA|nr:hypothetical protein [Labrys sp. KNU-23]QEN84777.1 hypothetical protein FZC33_00345 [Labrys sp. KNU-23]